MDYTVWPEGILKAPWKDLSHWMSKEVGSFSDPFLPDNVTEGRGPMPGVSPDSGPGPRPRWPVPTQLLPQESSTCSSTDVHASSSLVLLTASHLLCLLHRNFWEVTMSFYYLLGFTAGLTDLRVILLPPAPKLSVLSQRVRKEATCPTMEDGGLVKVLWLHWYGEDAAACGVTSQKTWGPGMPSRA